LEASAPDSDTILSETKLTAAKIFLVFVLHWFK